MRSTPSLIIQIGNSKNILPIDDTITYRGTSMYPTFIDGDVLFVDKNRHVHLGDVVVFPSNSIYIIHRIVGIESDNIQTQGDNNQYPDPYPPDRRNIIGVVTHRRRIGVTSPVWMGSSGLMYHLFMRWIHRPLCSLLLLFKPAYDLLSKGAVLCCILYPVLDVKTIVLIKDGRIEVRLFVNGHYAGYRKGADRPWFIRAPFRFVLDPDRLPEYSMIVLNSFEQIRQSEDDHHQK
ncbi:MAG: signal peptidase I [Methanobacteriota archaeon]